MIGKQVPDPSPDHLLRWMEALQRRVARELMVAFDSNPPIARGRQGRLLQLIPAEGQRLSELASRARVTKQALGQMVAALEDAGMVVTTVDPADGRARIVRRTAQGDGVLARIERSIARVEERLRAEIGDRRYDAMVEAMRRLGDDVLS